MSAFDDAIVNVMIADFINIDQAGKFNGIGMGFQFTAITAAGTSPSQFVAAIVDLPQKYANQRVDLSLELFDLTDGGVFQVPNPHGRPEALRAQQLFTVPAPHINVPGFQAPSDLTCRLQMVLGFPNGLPLSPGKTYEWRASVDHQRRKGWVARFLVLEPTPPPVLGGPAAPSDIPNVHLDETTDDDVVNGDG